MTGGFVSLSRAMLLGFVRDRTALFFTILFPLMFLVLFGGLFKDQGESRSKVIEVGQVALLDAVPADAKAELAKVLDVTKMDDPAKALDAVRKGDYTASIEQQGDRVVLHFSAADQVRAGTVRGVMSSLVQETNLATSTNPGRLTLDAQQVEDKSFEAIQFVTPGLLGWAIATGATFGAAMTLVTWRQKKILRRLRLSPVSVGSLVGARVGVSLGIALLQTAIFVGVALLPYFGLKLSSYWWMSIPVVLVGTLAFLSIGLLAGAWAKTQEAANVIAQLIVLPMAFLSGSFFPLDNAPKWLQAIAEVLPLRHLNQAMLDVMVRGKGPAAVLPELGILAGFAIVVSLAAARLFRWDDV
ncbi:ABC transporter permease [Planosporangium sp. 12N6]|uniref:ABC transporter permease n=1 Tax=Planosporangium spinosum TaxID=3402278 RepID=UPI003CE9A412